MPWIEESMSEDEIELTECIGALLKRAFGRITITAEELKAVKGCQISIVEYDTHITIKLENE